MKPQDKNENVILTFFGITLTQTETGRVRLYLGNKNLFSWKSRSYVKHINVTIQKFNNASLYLATIDYIFDTQRQNPDFETDIRKHCLSERLGMLNGMDKSDLQLVLNTGNLIYDYHYNPNQKPDYIVKYGLQPNLATINTLNIAKIYNIPFFFCETGFLRSATTFAEKCNPLYNKGISYNFDPFGPYFDCTNENLLWRYLNDQELNLSEEQLKRARTCIDFIIENYLTKYNNQPVNDHLLDDVKGKKVLVVDQSFGDMSIYRGGANDLTFKIMLEKACEENPDSTILVKTHPDSIASAEIKAYYAAVKPTEQIKRLTDPINPISLIKQCDRVYVCTSQFGFEALMCGKDVQIFGKPFYAGYGVGNCRQNTQRLRQRSIEEIFYLAYIKYTHYINPFTNQRCEIEEAMDCLLKLRDQYAAEYGKKIMP